MNDKEKKIMNSYAKKVTDKGMSVPAVFFLEIRSLLATYL